MSGLLNRKRVEQCWRNSYESCDSDGRSIETC